jgi:hypothetical protein
MLFRVHFVPGVIAWVVVREQKAIALVPKEATFIV